MNRGELLLTIVDDILDFSKISAGQLVLESVDFDFVDLINGVVDALRATVRSQQPRLVLLLDPAIPAELRGDPNRLRQVLNNLLSNAIKFTSIGEVQLRVAKIEETDANVVVAFEVKDTGIGIAPEVQKHLFRPFVQAEQSISRRFGGTGLGLVISAQLVEQMGAVIELESELGKGSTFHFTLRLQKGEQVRCVTIANPHRELRKDIQVLVVEDNLTNQALIKEQLAVLGYSFRVTPDASGALQALGDAHYDIVLMDCELPGMDGYQATAEIRRREGNGKHIKIIALTAYVTEHQRERCLADRMNGYLGKPIKLHRLAEALDAGSRVETISADPARAGDQGIGRELDSTALAEIAQLSKVTGRDIFRELGDRFLADLSIHAGLITTALESCDMGQLAAVVHPLTSASAIVGAKSFSDLCAKVEQSAREGSADQAFALAAQLLEAAQTLPHLLGAAADN